LRQALRADLPAIADLWVDAFASDPFLRWMQPDDAGWPAFGRMWMGFVLDLTFERGHTYCSDPLDVAVAWVPPDVALVTPDDLDRARELTASHVGEAHADAVWTTILAARGHGMEVPHWTLQYLGARSSKHGSGLGQLAVAPILARCDEDGLPCGLVSTNPRNVSFYERNGFVVQAEVPTPDEATALRPMERQPR
jgi:GNAT superfamily N-acetyltransferase